MSLYLGDDTNDTPILHITSSPVSEISARSPVSIGSTSFHSNSTFATMQLKYAIPSINVAPIIYYNPSRYLSMQRMDYPIEIKNAMRSGTDKKYFIFTYHPGTGLYTFVNGPSATARNLADSYYRYVYDGQYAITTSVNNTTTDEFYVCNVSNYGTTISYFSGESILYIYEIILKPPTTGNGITVANGDIVVGDYNLSSYQYLNLFTNNTIDVVYQFDSMSVQVLNSRIDNADYHGLSINGNEVSTVVGGIQYPLFGNQLKTTTNVVHTSSVDNVNDVTVPFDTTDSIILLSNITMDIDTQCNGYSGVSPDSNNNFVQPIILSGNASFGFDIGYWQDPIYADGYYIGFSFNHITKVFGVVGYSWFDGGYMDWCTRLSCTITILK